MSRQRQKKPDDFWSSLGGFISDRENVERVDFIIKSLHDAWKTSKQYLDVTRDVEPYFGMLGLTDDNTLKEVYRLLAKRLHPDRGGSPEKMALLNDFWGKIKKQRKMN